MTVKAKYKGKEGQFLNDIPAKDLDEEEYAALSTEQKKEVRESDLYEVVVEIAKKEPN